MRDDLPVEKIAITYLLLVLSGIILAAGLFPDMLWGLALPAEYPLALVVGFLALSLAGLVPRVQEKIVSFLQPSGLDSASPHLRPFHIILIASLAAAAACSFTVPWPIMGDGVLHVYQYVPRPGDAPNINNHSPFLSIFLVAIYRLIFLALGRDSAQVVQAGEMGNLAWSIVSAVGTFSFIILLLKVLSQSAGDKHNFRVFAALLFTSGTMAVFSGFVEIAVVLLPVLLLYILMVLYTLKKDSGPWLFAGTLFFCLGFHASMVAIVPSAAYVAYCKREQIKERPFTWLAATVVTAGVFLLLISLLTGLGSFADLFLSGRDSLKLISTGESPYTLFSPYHLLELGNVLLLHNPLNFIFAAWIFFAAAVFGERWRNDRVSVFLLLLLLGYTGMLFVFHALLGIVRDWDIFSPLGILLPLTAGRLWLICVDQENRKRIAPAAAVLLPLAMLHLFVWVHLSCCG